MFQIKFAVKFKRFKSVIIKFQNSFSENINEIRIVRFVAESMAWSTNKDERKPPKNEAQKSLLHCDPRITSPACNET